MKTIRELDRQYIANTYNRFDVVFTEGRGSELFDETGKRYIDLSTGIAVNTLGIADDAWVAAVTEQIRTLSHTSNLYFSEPQVRLAEQLCLRSGMKKVFFSNSGAEANECAIKVARKYASDRLGQGTSKHTIITLRDSFHGRTITTLSATGQDVFHTSFDPFTPGFVYAEPNNLGSLQQLAQENDCCAVLLELVQGEGGVRVLDPEYIRSVADFCCKNDILLMIDEVQTGNGRTGTLFAFEQYGIVPDVVTTAKGLAGGLPFGATLLGDKVEHTLTAGSHGSTFGGNLISARGALCVLERIDEPLLADVRRKGELIKTTLAGQPGIKAVEGLGLMVGISTERPAGEIVSALLKRGVVALTAKERVRLLPALTIPTDLLKEALDIILDEAARV